MKAIESARLTVFAQACALLRLAPAGVEGPSASALQRNDLDTAKLGQGLVMTAAQDLGFFARSSAWRCASCGKMHLFEERVSVVSVSPCACAGIEFEPNRGSDVLASIANGDLATPHLLTV